MLSEISIISVSKNPPNRLYYGTSSTTLSPPYGSGVNVGNVTSYTVTGLEKGTRYYFNATAVDAQGKESILSNQAFKDIP